MTSEEPGLEISIVMPCLNEAETLPYCVAMARSAIEHAGISGEVVVADNGSTDGSREVAERLGARVVRVEAKGYGNALLGGIAAARGRYVLMGDADGSYDFSHLPRFLEKLREGYALVMGNRFRGGVLPGAMPPLHRWVGNPVLSGIGRLFFRSPCGDFHCGLRAFDREAVLKLDLRTTGMEFASEMVVKATLHRLSIAEVPTTLSPDRRGRPPHLRSWRDGWRHLRFLLLYSPQWLFLYPGAILMIAGLALGAWLLPGPRRVGGVTLDVHTLFYAALMVVIGFQSVSFALFTRIFAVTEGLRPSDPGLEALARHATLERGLVVGVLIVLAGLGGSIWAVSAWEARSFGNLDPVTTLRMVIPAGMALTLGCQVVLASFFLSVLGLGRK